MNVEQLVKKYGLHRIFGSGELVQLVVDLESLGVEEASEPTPEPSSEPELGSDSEPEPESAARSEGTTS